MKTGGRSETTGAFEWKAVVADGRLSLQGGVWMGSGREEAETAGGRLQHVNRAVLKVIGRETRKNKDQIKT